MSASVFFDTQIIATMADGHVPAQVWPDLIGAIRGRYQYRASFTTFLELLNALAGGDEGHFQQNRRRLLMLTDVPGFSLLPLPGQFIRTHVLGLTLQRPEFSPDTVERGWLPIIKRAQTKRELAEGMVVRSYPNDIDLQVGMNLTQVRKHMEHGQKLWAEEIRLARDGQKAMPPRELYAEFILHFDARGDATAENISRVSSALDAAYCHLAHVHHQSTKGNYRFDKNQQDWIDNQQLMYLADPDCTFVTADERLIAKLGRSTQRSRVRVFRDFCHSLGLKEIGS